MPNSTESSTSSLLSLFSPVCAALVASCNEKLTFAQASDYELIPRDQLKDYVVYSSSNLTPTHRIEVKSEPARSRYRGSMSEILRADMMPTNKATDHKQDVVCKEIIEYGETGTVSYLSG